MTCAINSRISKGNSERRMGMAGERERSVGSKFCHSERENPEDIKS